MKNNDTTHFKRIFTLYEKSIGTPIEQEMSYLCGRMAWAWEGIERSESGSGDHKKYSCAYSYSMSNADELFRSLKLEN